jgi:nitroreductase
MASQGTTSMTSVLGRCVAEATLAPSLHNSQPWRFRLVGQAIEVYADRGRQIEVLDPYGRELLMSVGAALFTLRLALRAEGRIPDTTLLPDPARPDLVAVVRPGPHAEPSAAVREMAAAIHDRHTNRRPFQARVVPADILDELRTAAGHEGADLIVADAASRAMIVALGRQAEKLLSAQGGYRTELARWTHPSDKRRDGIPYVAMGPWDALERMPMRDFGLVHPQPWQRAEEFERFPTIAVIRTGGDEPSDWLHAGQALQRVLLVATRRHLATTPISQPVEVPVIREVLSDAGAGRWAQMVVRLGYASPAVTTPRRPVTEVLEENPS